MSFFTADLWVIVYDADDPNQVTLQGAECTLVNLLDGETQTRTTDTSGLAIFSDLFPSRYNLTVEREGYYSQDKAVAVAGELVQLGVGLRRLIIGWPPYTLTVRVESYNPATGSIVALPGALVEIMRRGDNWYSAKYTDSAGGVYWPALGPDGDPSNGAGTFDVNASKGPAYQIKSAVVSIGGDKFGNYVPLRLTINPYIITVQTDGHGSVSPVAGNYQVYPAQFFEVSASPISGWHFDKWLVSGGIALNDSTLTTVRFQPTADGTIKATFAQTVQISHKLTVSKSGSGNTDHDGESTWIQGTTVRVTATPASGWVIKEWVVDGVVRAPSPYVDIVMNADHSASVAFSEEPDPGTERILTIEIAGNGTVTPNIGDKIGENKYSYLYPVKVTLTASATPSTWALDGVQKQIDKGSFEVTMNDNHTVKVTFGAGSDLLIPALILTGLTAAAVGFAMRGKSRPAPAAPAYTPTRTRRRSSGRN